MMNSLTPLTFDDSSARGTSVLRWALAIGLVLRLVILWQTPGLGTVIVDEQQYRLIATNIVAGNGFGWGPGDLTSIRPPLFPGLLAATWTLTGSENLQVIRAIQIGLSLLTTLVVYQIGARVYNKPVARYAAAVCWLYPSLIFFDFLMLTETLFTLLLLVFVLCTVLLLQRQTLGAAAACGAALALAALTRSVLWPLPLLFCPLLVLLLDTPWPRRLALAGLVLVGYVVVITPWAVRNTRLQGVLAVVDTMGGMNLRMGNYEYTPEDRMWDAVAERGDRNWAYGIDADFPEGHYITEGEKEKWAQRKAIAYMLAHPGITMRRALIKFADFWGLEREFIAGVQSGLFTPPRWFQLLGAVAIIGGYALTVLGGAAGLWLAPAPNWRLQIALLLPVLLITAAHTIVFGHSRYHIPLMPIAAIWGAALWLTWPAAMVNRTRLASFGALATTGLLLVIWARQILFVDLARLSSLWQHIG